MAIDKSDLPFLVCGFNVRLNRRFSSCAECFLLIKSVCFELFEMFVRLVTTTLFNIIDFLSSSGQCSLFTFDLQIYKCLLRYKPE